MNTGHIPLLILIAHASLLAQSGRVADTPKNGPARPGAISKITIPPEPVTPSGFDFGALSEQGKINQYRIEKLEDSVGKLESVIDRVKGAWLALVGVVAVVVAACAFVLKAFGRYAFKAFAECVALALHEYYGREKLAGPGDVPPVPPHGP